MKVLQINSVCGIRSTGRIATDISDELCANGIENKIIYGRFEIPEKYESISFRNSTDFASILHYAKSLMFDRHGFGSKKATERMIKFIDEYNPDIIHLHNIHGYYVNIEMLFNYIKKINVPVVWTFHDCWSFTGHCSYFDLVNCDKWKNGCKNCPQTKEYPKSLFVDNSKKNWKQKKEIFATYENMTIVTPSYWLKKLSEESFFKGKRVEVIYNTIDYDTFKPTKNTIKKDFGIEDKYLVLGVASAWCMQKGLYDFIELSKMLDNNYQIILVGLDKEQIKEVPKNIIVVEKTNSKEELAEFYSAADVFLNLTYEDNYPTTNLESQACGTPCITYATGGSVESVPQENVIEKGNLSAVVRRIKEGNLPVNENKNKNMAKEYLRLYKDILDNN